MSDIVERLQVWIYELENKPKPVTGWLPQWLLLLLALAHMWYGLDPKPYLAAAITIGVMRAIEKERRSDYDKR